MTNKRTRDEYDGRQTLQRAGWPVQKRDSVAFNSGSETKAHIHVKMAVAYVLRERGYRVDTEVVNDEQTAEADVVGYSNGEPPFVVECETGVDDDVTKKKLDQFYYNQPFRECFILEVNDAPSDIHDLHAWVEDELF